MSEPKFIMNAFNGADCPLCDGTGHQTVSMGLTFSSIGYTSTGVKVYHCKACNGTGKKGIT